MILPEMPHAWPTRWICCRRDRTRLDRGIYAFGGRLLSACRLFVRLFFHMFGATRNKDPRLRRFQYVAKARRSCLVRYLCRYIVSGAGGYRPQRRA